MAGVIKKDESSEMMVCASLVLFTNVIEDPTATVS